MSSSLSLKLIFFPYSFFYTIIVMSSIYLSFSLLCSFLSVSLLYHFLYSVFLSSIQFSLCPSFCPCLLPLFSFLSLLFGCISNCLFFTDFEWAVFLLKHQRGLIMKSLRGTCTHFNGDSSILFRLTISSKKLLSDNLVRKTNFAT